MPAISPIKSLGAGTNDGLDARVSHGRNSGLPCWMWSLAAARLRHRHSRKQGRQPAAAAEESAGTTKTRRYRRHHHQSRRRQNRYAPHRRHQLPRTSRGPGRRRCCSGRHCQVSVATSTGLAYCRRNTRTSVSASALSSMALMICVRCRMFACVSVIIMELPGSFATTVACGETNEDKSDTSWLRPPRNRIGMIYVTISAFFGIFHPGSLPVFTGISRVLACVLIYNGQGAPVTDGGVTASFDSAR